MTENNGRSLEHLVSLIEGHLSPQGFTIETRKPVYDQDGIQIAEFDIVISGHVGSAPLTCLIECRDRPSEGPAPGSWIEQLMGRRMRFRIDKVMAVSSTGFSPGATQAATDAGIQLRHLDRLTVDDVADWLPQNAPILIRDGKIQSVRVLCDSDDSHSNQFPIESDKLFLISPEKEEKISLMQIWQQLINLNSVWDNITEGGDPVEKTIVVSDYITENFIADFGESQANVLKIEFDAIFHAYAPIMPLTEANAYSSVELDPNTQKKYAQLGRWKGSDESIIKEMIIIGFLQDTSTEQLDLAIKMDSEESGA